MTRDSDGAGMPAGLDPKPVTYRDDGTRPASFNGYLPD